MKTKTYRGWAVVQSLMEPWEPYCFGATRKRAVETHLREYHDRMTWRWLRDHGWRCVRVTVRVEG